MTNHTTVLEVPIVVSVTNGDDAHIQVSSQLRETHRQISQDGFFAFITRHCDHILNRFEEDILATVYLCQDPDLFNQFVRTIFFPQVELHVTRVVGNVLDGLLYVSKTVFLVDQVLSGQVVVEVVRYNTKQTTQFRLFQMPSGKPDLWIVLDEVVFQIPHELRLTDTRRCLDHCEMTLHDTKDFLIQTHDTSGNVGVIWCIMQQFKEVFFCCIDVVRRIEASIEPSLRVLLGCIILQEVVGILVHIVRHLVDPVGKQVHQCDSKLLSLVVSIKREVNLLEATKPFLAVLQQLLVRRSRGQRHKGILGTHHLKARHGIQFALGDGHCLCRSSRELVHAKQLVRLKPVACCKLFGEETGLAGAIRIDVCMLSREVVFYIGLDPVELHRLCCDLARANIFPVPRLFFGVKVFDNLQHALFL